MSVLKKLVKVPRFIHLSSLILGKNFFWNLESNVARVFVISVLLLLCNRVQFLNFFDRTAVLSNSLLKFHRSHYKRTTLLSLYRIFKHSMRLYILMSSVHDKTKRINQSAANNALYLNVKRAIQRG